MRLPRNITRDNKDDGVWDLPEDGTRDTAQWGLVGAQMYKGFPKTENKLPSGVYGVTLDRNDDRPIFTRRAIKTDDIFDLGDPILDTVISEVRGFWQLGAKFKKMGFLHRRGYLFYGPQGTGKSSVVKQLMQDVIATEGIVLLCDNPKFFDIGLTALRQAEPDRWILCVFEDIDAIIERYGEDELLSILDGANMVDKVLNIATTNYPEKLDRRLVSRPRRFDRVIKVDVPGETVRYNFFKTQLPKFAEKKLVKLTKDTNGLSMAALSEVIISTQCLGNSMEKTLGILRALEDDNPSSSEFGKGGTLGFNSEDDNEDD